MEEKETYGIELELIMDKFRERINQVKKTITGIKEEKVNVGFDGAQLESITIKMQELQNLLNANAQKPFMSSREVLETRVELEKLNKQYNKLSGEQDKIIIKGKIGFGNINNVIKKATSKIKRFGLALLGIRSIFSLISRASSAYLAQDAALSNKMQATWIALGAMMEPIISRIADLMIKGVKYINIFIKALTGVDLLAKAVSKSMNKTNASAKALNKTLAGFDELTNLNSDSGAGSGIDTGWIDAINNTPINTEWADKIQRFGEWVCANKGNIISAFAGIAGAIAGIKLGLGGIKSLGLGAIIAGTTKAIISLMTYLESPTWKNFGSIIEGIGIGIVGLGLITGNFELVAAGVIVALTGLIVSNWDKITSFLENGFNWLENAINGLPAPLRYVLNGIAGTVKEIVYVIVNQLDGIFNAWKGILDGMIKVFKGDFKTGFTQVGKSVVNIWIGMINGLTAGINSILSPFRSIIVEAGKIAGKNWTMSNISIPKIPLLNVGTNYVPEDQMAYIHKGEAVIPKKFNSQEYFGSGNEETNSLLEKVIEAIENIEVNPYTTIKDVGKNAVEYINAKTRQTGRSVIA